MESLGSRLVWYATSQTSQMPIVFNALQAVWVAWCHKRARRQITLSSFLETLVGTLVLGFGGSTMTGKPWGWVQAPLLFPIYTLATLAVNYSPFDFVFRTLETNAHFLEPLFIANDSVSKTLSIVCNGSQLALKQGADGMASLVPSVLCGTISGCGGGVLFNALGLYDAKWKFQCPEQLRRPSIAMFLSFAAAVMYTVNHLGLLAPLSGKQLPHVEAIAMIFMMIFTVSLTAYFRSSRYLASKKAARGGKLRPKRHHT